MSFTDFSRALTLGTSNKISIRDSPKVVHEKISTFKVITFKIQESNQSWNPIRSCKQIVKLKSFGSGTSESLKLES